MTKKIWLVLAASLLLSVSCGDPGFDHSSSPSIDSSDSLKDKEFEEGSPLLFSEFYLGELIKNRVVEVANFGTEPLSLKNYSIRIYHGTEKTTSYTIPLGDKKLQSMETFCVAYSQIEEQIHHDMVSADFMNNGTWPMGLFRGETRVDTLGEIGYTNAFASNEVIIRKNEYRIGREKGERYDWIGYPAGYSSNLGNAVCPVSEEELLAGPKLTEEQLKLPYAVDNKGTGGAVEVTVSHLGDGDTTVFNYPSSMSEFRGCSLRYQNIDTPEVQHGNTIQEQPWGEAAAKWNNQILSSAKHILVQSVEGGALTESFGRLLGFVWVSDKDNPTAADYRNLNHWTILEGYSKYAFASATSIMMSGELRYNSFFADANARGLKTGIRLFGEKDPNFNYDRA